MVAIIFAATTGFNVFTHVCFMSGNKEISVKEIDLCCKTNEEPADDEIKANCCLQDSGFYKLDFTALKEKLQLQKQKIVIAYYLQFPPLEEKYFDILIPNYNDLPPPKSGRDVLSHKQVFRI